jgi:hypothetical protein
MGTKKVKEILNILLYLLIEIYDKNNLNIFYFFFWFSRIKFAYY